MYTLWKLTMRVLKGKRPLGNSFVLIVRADVSSFHAYLLLSTIRTVVCSVQEAGGIGGLLDS